MRTDDLIRSMVADVDVQAPSLSRRFGLALALGFAVSAAAFWILLGPRPDLAAAAQTLRFDVKIVQMLLIGAAATVLVLRLSRPAVPASGAALALLAVPVLIAVAVVVELTLLPRAEWLVSAVGTNAVVCVTAIPLLALPILAAAIVALRDGAPTRPELAGAIAGLVAGGFAAVLYAIHCTDDSPLFVALWYGVAFAVTASVGAAAGRLFLRW